MNCTLNSLELHPWETHALESIKEEFLNVFLTKLSYALSPSQVVDNKDLVLGSQPMSIALYKMSQLKEDDILQQLSK